MSADRTVSCNGVPAHGYGKPGPEDRRRVRVTGNAERAWLETAPMWISCDRVIAWVPEFVPGTVTVDERGRVSIVCDELDPAARRALESSFRTALKDERIVDPEPGTRHLTRNYVALDRDEAEFNAAVDGGPIETTTGVHVVHATDSWALWTDGRVTTSIGLPAWAKKARALSREAARLIFAVYGSDSGPPACGYALLAQVAETIGRREIETGPRRGVYAADTVEELRVRLTDGSERTLYQRSAGYSEGYEFEIALTLAEVWAEGEERIQAGSHADA